MIELTVNGKPTTVPEGAVLLEAVRAAGVELPTLCRHGARPSWRQRVGSSTPCLLYTSAAADE
jgi:predicted molibdopterin-dependent oxidoreductase YjgC